MEEYCWYILYVQDVVGDHMIMHIFLHDETCKHEGMLFHKGGVCDTHEIQGKTREFHWFELYRSI